jgi:hypothetical protein
MNNVNVISGIIGAGLIGGLTAFSASASVDSTTSKTTTQVTPAQTVMTSDTKKSTPDSEMKIEETTLACMACSNI